MRTDTCTIHGGPFAGTYFYCYDGNHNIVALVSAADGSLAAQYDYDAFGKLLRATGPLAFVNPFLYSTTFVDWETGLYSYGYRYFNPSTGRWLSRDPIEEKGWMLANPETQSDLEQTGNLYAFVSNDSINAIDVLGNLGYTTVSLTKKDCGGYIWNINWIFARGEVKGYVVQKVSYTQQVNHCNGKPYPWSPKSAVYWEAFEVYNAQAELDSWNNVFNPTSDTYGKIHVDGDAAFFGIGDKAAMGAIATWTRVPGSRGLPGTTTPPAFWPGTGTHVVRYLDDWWNCCCGWNITSIITK